MSVHLEIKIKFLDEVVILSFARRLNHPDEAARNDWIETRTHTLFPNLSQEEFTELMLLSDTITTLDRAIHERDQLLQQQTSEFIIYFLTCLN